MVRLIPSRRRLRRTLLACALLLVPAGASAQPTDPPDPFDNISVRQFGNGLTAWFRRVPGAATTSISLSIPFGSDRDPVGREQLAHVLEHALFAARDGRTEEQITRDINDRGGSFNATTSPDRVHAWASVGREHSDFAIDWLYQRIAPRVWEDSLLPDIRAAVALELGIAPPNLLDWLRARYIMNPRLRPPGFWQREFGIEAPEYRTTHPWLALEAIDAHTLDSLYRAHYSPVHMTVFVAGDLDSTAVFRHLQRTFGSLPVWGTERTEPDYHLKEGATHRHFWNLRQDIGLTIGFRIDSLDADGHVRLLFIRELLEHRLMRRLRWSDQTAVYGVGSSLTLRGPIAYLRLYSTIRPEAYERAEAIVADELQRLRQGRYPAGEFEQDRAAITLYLRLNSGTPAALRGWHLSTLYRPEFQPDPPALGTRFAAVTPADLSAFAAAQLGPGREIVTIERPLPMPPALVVLAMGMALALGFAFARTILLRPVPMRRLRYVARLRPPALLRLLAILLALTALLVGLRLVAAALHFFADDVLYASSSFLVQGVPVLVTLALAGCFVHVVLAFLPSKLLVFEHELRIKYVSYRTTRIGAADIVDVVEARFQDVWLSKDLFRTVPLAFGLRQPALLVRTRRGPDWFLAVRDREELAAAVTLLRTRGRVSADVWLN